MDQLVRRATRTAVHANSEATDRHTRGWQPVREPAKVESVWDYPRPPRVESTSQLIRVEFADAVVAETTRALRVLETSHPPTIYIPRLDIDEALLRPSPLLTFCEFKGEASYLDLVISDRVSPEAAWEYLDPSERFKSLIGHVAFYPGRVDACFIDGEPVKAQDGGLYGGWITSAIVGPFKGSPGSRDW